jgi:hypothetical protein
VIRELQAKGLTVRGMAAELKAQNREPRGGRWHAQTVVKLMIERPSTRA